MFETMDELVDRMFGTDYMKEKRAEIPTDFEWIGPFERRTKDDGDADVNDLHTDND